MALQHVSSLCCHLKPPRQVVASSIQSVASVMELALHNADDYPIEWKIQTDSLGKFKGVFTVDPQSGILHPAQDCLVRAAFLPSEPIEYKANVNVYISPPRSSAPDAGGELGRGPKGLAASLQWDA